MRGSAARKYEDDFVPDIDHPPRAPREADDNAERDAERARLEEEGTKQLSMFPVEEVVESLNAEPAERVFEVQLTVKLGPDNRKAISLPLVDTRCSSRDVLEVLSAAITGRQNQAIITAILDNPLHKPVGVDKTGL